MVDYDSSVELINREEYGSFGMLREQIDPEELRALYIKLDRARNGVTFAAVFSIIIAVVNILLGTAAILLPGVLLIEDFFVGIGVLDYIIFGVLYISLSIGISRCSRMCAVIAMMVFAADAAAGVYFGAPPVGYVMKAIMLIGLMQGVIGSIRYNGLKKKYRDSSDREIKEIFASNKPTQKKLHIILAATAVCIGIGSGVYGIAEVSSTGRSYGNETYLSAIIPGQFLPTAHPRIDSLDYLFEPVQTWTSGGKVVNVDGVDVNIEYVAEYSIAGRVVGTENYTPRRDSPRRIIDKISPKDVAMVWGWLSDKNVDSEIVWGPFSYRGFHYTVSRDSSLVGVGSLLGYLSNNHLVVFDDEKRALIDDIEVGHYVRIEGYLVNVNHIDDNGNIIVFNSDTARNNNDCEVIYVTNVTWLRGPTD